MENTIHLQGIGEKPAVQAREIKVGDIMVWNFGYTEKVTGIEFSKSGKTMKVSITCESGYEGVRRMNATRLVALA